MDGIINKDGSIEHQIGEIENYYGGLRVKKYYEKRYWSITNYDGDDWQEIPLELYNMLLSYEQKRRETKKTTKTD